MNRSLRDELITTWKRIYSGTDDSSEPECALKTSAQARIAICLDDLELAREIDSAEVRAWSTSSIFLRRGDRESVQKQIELAREIGYQLIREQTIAGIVKSTDDRQLLESLRSDVVRATDDSTRDGMLRRLAEFLPEPGLIEEIGSYEERLGALLACSMRIGDAGLAQEALESSIDRDDIEGTIRALEVIGRINDQALMRKATRIACKLVDPCEKAVALDALGRDGLSSSYTRNALRMILDLPEFVPATWDDTDIAGTRDVPLSILARRHFNPVLAGRVRSPIVRSSVMSAVARQRVDHALALRIEGIRDRIEALIAIAARSKDLDLIARLRTKCEAERFDDLLLESLIAEANIRSN